MHADNALGERGCYLTCVDVRYHCCMQVSFASGAKSMFEAAASFSAQAAPAGGSGVEATIEVAFEPSSLGEGLRDTLILTSATGGEYQVPLLGRCVAPRPQGPVDCSKGSAAVPFKNVFATDAEFFFR